MILEWTPRVLIDPMTEPLRDDRRQLIREFRQRLEDLARAGVDRIPAPVLPAGPPRRTSSPSVAPPPAGRPVVIEEPRGSSEPPPRPAAATPAAAPPRPPPAPPPP
ncbi:MAG: hypothetical protein QOE66_1236, partial [Chloroflexota bacterium]|nr:hypothetical protein [Chloroflexota bacterium]